MSEMGKGRAYAGLIFVIFIWGISPLVTLYFYDFFSPTIRISIGAAVSGIAMLLISLPQRRLLDKSYFKIAVPTGACVAIANILQKIGLQYTTPTHYAFLENLSVVLVPVLLFLLTRKKPNALTITASFLCLVSSMILTGMLTGGATVNWTGDLLCALAGLFYGVNIAVTGTYAKRFFVPLYLTIQILVEALISFVSALVFDAVGIEEILFTPDLLPILLNVGFVLISSTLGWLIRTNAMKKVDPTVVAVMMPFSSVVTTIASIFMGKDTVSYTLIIGAVLGFVAIILSGLGDRTPKKEAE